MNKRCEACELRPFAVREPCDSPETPYLVCSECHVRLLARSLRPLEWFNLAKRYGWSQYLLHDDFYDQDGVAWQPEHEVESADSFPMPALGAIAGSSASLLDYSITRWRFDEELRELWKGRPVVEALAVLGKRFDESKNPAVLSTVLEAAAVSLGSAGSGLVRQAWSEYPNGVPFWPLVQASSGCLPFGEAFERAEFALKVMNPKDMRENMSALAHFNSPRTISWVEANACEPTTEDWGYLVAASQFSWAKAEEWLIAGRPLSLIAIDALRAIAEPRTSFLSALKPTLIDPPDELTFWRTLRRYAAADPVPRVRQRVEALLKHSAALVTAPAG